MLASGTAFPSASLTVQRTSKGSPSASWEIDAPWEACCASCVWKGPRRVPSVLFVGLGWSIESTRRERPRMSERRMNSYLTSVLIWPTAVRKRRAVIHSCEERRVSRAKSWKWVTSFSSKNLRRGFGVCELIAWTFSVMFSIVRFLRPDGEFGGCVGADIGEIATIFTARSFSILCFSSCWC
jgi:hypothetical protein